MASRIVKALFMICCCIRATCLADGGPGEVVMPRQPTRVIFQWRRKKAEKREWASARVRGSHQAEGRRIEEEETLGLPLEQLNGRNFIAIATRVGLPLEQMNGREMVAIATLTDLAAVPVPHEIKIPVPVIPPVETEPVRDRWPLLSIGQFLLSFFLQFIYYLLELDE